MDIKNIFIDLREKHQLTQNQLADKLHVTRQAVSRWECGKTIPSVDTLQIISKEFNVSINSLLGSSKKLVCQCCGMPLYADEVISREKTGEFNEEYCKWCYHDGKMEYTTLEALIPICVPFLMQSNPSLSEKDAKEYFMKQVLTLKYWN